MAQLDVNATDFQRVLTSGFTQAQFITWVKDNFTSCGFPTPITETTGTNPKIIVYNLDYTSGLGSANNYYYVIHIPTITNATNFTLTHGLFRTDRYNTTTFLRTVNYVGAADTQTTATQLPGNSSITTLNNNNSYTAYNFPVSLEFRGFGIRANSTGNFIFFCGVTLPETIHSHVDLTANLVLGLVTDINSVCSASFVNYASLPYPNLNQTNGTNNTLAYLGAKPFVSHSISSYLAGGVELISSFSYSIANNTTSSVVGRYSNDIVFGSLNSFPFGTIIQITPGIEEYFVVSSANPGWAIRVLN